MNAENHTDTPSSDESRYQCAVCGEWFDDEAALEAHVRDVGQTW